MAPASLSEVNMAPYRMQPLATALFHNSVSSARRMTIEERRCRRVGPRPATSCTSVYTRSRKASMISVGCSDVCVEGCSEQERTGKVVVSIEVLFYRRAKGQAAQGKHDWEKC